MSEPFETSIAIIGAGQMGEAMADGFVESKKATKSTIYLCVRRAERIPYFKSKGYMNVSTDLLAAVSSCKTIFLCAKPGDIPNILTQIRPNLREEHLIVSIAAGLTLNLIEDTINKQIGIIRVMPNNCCIVKASATVYCMGKFATEAQAVYLEDLMQTLGMVYRTQEKLMDTFTGFTGSGPAYACLFIQSLADGAVRNGVPRDQAIKFAAQLLYGAGKLVLETKKHPAYLIDSVMTPAGTTVEGLLVLEKSAVRAHVVRAVTEGLF